MEIQIKKTGRAVVFAPFGKLDAITAPDCEASLNALIAEGANCLVLDFGGVNYISSAGLRVVLATAKIVKNSGGRLLLANLGGIVKEVFDISGFGSIFSFYDSVEDALSEVGQTL